MEACGHIPVWSGQRVEWVFRKSVTGDFGIVTGGFGNVTGHFGDVTAGPVLTLRMNHRWA